MTRGRDWSVLLRSGDPVGGDPVALAELARRYAGTAEALASGEAALRRVRDSSTVWASPAGRAFVERTDRVVEALRQVLPRYERTAEALHRYAGELAQVQDDADRLLAAAWRAFDERDAADRVWRADDGADPDRGRVLAERAEQADAELRALERRLQGLESAWASAGTTAAAALGEATEADGLDDGRWDVLVVVEAVADVSAAVSTAFGWASLVCLTVPGLQPFLPVTGGIAAGAGLVSLAATGVLTANDRATGDELAVATAWTLVGLATAGVARAAAAPASAVVATAAGRTADAGGAAVGGVGGAGGAGEVAGEVAGAVAGEVAGEVAGGVADGVAGGVAGGLAARLSVGGSPAVARAARALEPAVTPLQSVVGKLAPPPLPPGPDERRSRRPETACA